MRDEAGEVCGGQDIQGLFSWLRHLDIILKAEGFSVRGLTHLDIHIKKIVGCNIKNRLKSLSKGTGEPGGRHLTVGK